jgi:hypothetical protein
MNTTDQAVQPGQTRATLTFVVDTGEKPVTYADQQLEIGARMTGTYEDRDVALHDGRIVRGELSMDRQGFLLADHRSAVADFFDEAQLRAVGYPEVEALVREHTGAREVLIFDHTYRVEDLTKRRALNLRAPVPSVHNDYTDWSAPKRVRDLLPPALAEARLARRYIFVNVWRPLVGPVESTPLALCDASSLDPRDVLAADHVYDAGRRGETYRVVFNPGQRWFYFPRMVRDEVVLIKCFDSETDGRARFSAHGAARLHQPPPAGAPPRESIEIRTVAFY